MERPINVLISGTGSMGTEIAKTINARDDMRILPITFTGAEVEADVWDIGLDPEKYRIPLCRLVKPEDFEAEMVRLRKSGLGNIVAVEFGTPGTNNTELYIKHNISWVSGTTGVDRSTLRGNGIYDVNMALPLIAIGHGLEALANNPEFKDCLKGFSGYFLESHQLYKKDPSGTRGKWAESLKSMGASLDMLLPERLEPRGHGYHKAVMHHPESNSGPLKVWCSLFKYMSDNFREPFAGFVAETEESFMNTPLHVAVKDNAPALGIKRPFENRNAGETGGAEVSNVYFTLPDSSARIAFYANAHPDRGTNTGFKTEVDGRGIYMPGIMAAIKYVHEQFYEKGNKEMGVQSMMPVVKK